MQCWNALFQASHHFIMDPQKLWNHKVDWPFHVKKNHYEKVLTQAVHSDLS